MQIEAQIMQVAKLNSREKIFEPGNIFVRKQAKAHKIVAA